MTAIIEYIMTIWFALVLFFPIGWGIVKLFDKKDIEEVIKDG